LGDGIQMPTFQYYSNILPPTDQLLLILVHAHPT
jgi:hypothetical protein